MRSHGAIALAVISLSFYIFGFLCIFKTKMVVEWGRRSYDKSGFLSPFASLVAKPWYPTYIRCMGAFIWLWAMVIDCLVLFGGFH
jgi:hypothetical protein